MTKDFQRNGRKFRMTVTAAEFKIVERKTGLVVVCSKLGTFIDTILFKWGAS